MKLKAPNVLEFLENLRDYFQKNDPLKKYSDKEPLRSELFSSDRMKKYGQFVARSHKLMNKCGEDLLRKRLNQNEKILFEARDLFVQNIKEKKAITPGGEWILDNFYLIEQQIVIARKHFPKGYSEELPCLSNGHSIGLPRVYDIVLEIISHSDGRVDMNALNDFIESYQTVNLLKLGELWAIPIMLRLALIENLSRICSRIAMDMIDQNLAEYWVNEIKDVIKENPKELILKVADIARAKPLLTSPFVAGFVHKLQGQGPAITLPLTWIEDQLTALGLSGNEMIRNENQKQAADQVSVSNSIGTLRFLDSTDWREFVEQTSSVEKVLREDNIYPQMDFATRDSYRHVIEAIAKQSPLSEKEVAQKAIELTQQNNLQEKQSERANHVGFYLIDKGLPIIQKDCQMKLSFRQKLLVVAKNTSLLIYLGGIFLITFSVSFCVFLLAYLHGKYNWGVLTALTILSIWGTSQLAVALVNWLATIMVKPHILPRMDFSKTIPAEYNALVVVPTMLFSKSYIDEMVEGIEVRFLANIDPGLHYALLTDFKDADSEHQPDDDELVTYVKNKIEELNQKYNRRGNDIFFLFHRARTWNAREKKWMGYERKRGKLSALNAFLQNKEHNNFLLVVGDYTALTPIKYVITLDADTQLPRDAARKLAATMAHPLNRAVYNENKKRITEGYGILQPRIGVSLQKTKLSYYARLLGSDASIDPYTQVTSDVYQDVFGEGSFIGKGIYDVEMFEKALHNKLPDNRILSHDLLEGCYARSGFISDILLYEENPSQYSADIKRQHRWIRGDWQIGAWSLPFVPAMNGGLVKNRLSFLSLWKITDNLRRSLVPFSLVLLLLFGWTLSQAWLWTLILTLVVFLPVSIDIIWHAVRVPNDLHFKAHIKETFSSAQNNVLQAIFTLAMWPYKAFVNLHAIVLTGWRIYISRKHLLEWAPYTTDSKNRGTVRKTYFSMIVSPIVAFIGLGIVLYYNPGALLVAFPILTLWFLSPLIAYRISQPIKAAEYELSREQNVLLHKTARKTWSYFEKFMGPEDNWLPPDNYQEYPIAVLAHRTSPTNMGMALMANLTAYDFGYLAVEETVKRSIYTLRTMQQLERYKGHFFNWYDTLTKTTLNPRYVSTVDSGNLIGHLLTLRQGFLLFPYQAVVNPRIFSGIKDTVNVMREFISRKETEPLARMIELLVTIDENAPVFLHEIKKHLDLFNVLIKDVIQQIADKNNDPFNWAEVLQKQLVQADEELTAIIPWIDHLPVPSRFSELALLNNAPTLIATSQLPEELLPIIRKYESEENTTDENEWLAVIKTGIKTASQKAKEIISQINDIVTQCETFSKVDYSFLLRDSTGLLRIGYNVSEERGDSGFYDLLASEARLAVFVAIAQGKLPQESWFALGRQLTNAAGSAALLSWSGSMFEYLMPQLVMPSYENTLLHETNRAMIARQREYAKQRNVPWGISESGYNTVDVSLNYQYKAFGVPGLGLKRGLEEDLVIAPYATIMALMLEPEAACENLELLSKNGMQGQFGFYEAVDYTASRLSRGQTRSIIKSFMVHHQGMSFLSLSYLLLNKPMQQRFAAEKQFQATLLLLQERVPKVTHFYTHTSDMISAQVSRLESQIRIINTPNTPIPEVQLLSNSQYHVMLTNTGSGYSRWRDLAVTRWREDAMLDNWGSFCYIKDIETGQFWSNTYQPALTSPQKYEAIFSQGHVEYHRQDQSFETKTDIVISPEDDTELRRIRITNRSNNPKQIEVTSYAEVVLTAPDADMAHPVFSNLFVQTKILPQQKAILCTRRPRSETETPPWMFHLVGSQNANILDVSYETNRANFIGRNRTTADPEVMDKDGKLTGNEGDVLDPIVSIRVRITLAPHQTTTIDMVYGIGETKEICESLMYKYQDRHLKNRAFELAGTHSQVLLRQINASEADAQLYNHIAAYIIYNSAAFRPASSVISSNNRGQSGLWSHSISGDIPIVLLYIHNADNMKMAQQLIQAHTYWHLKGLAIDLVIWNEDYSVYRQSLQEQITGMVTAIANADGKLNDRKGNIYVKSGDQVSNEDRILFEAVARVIIHDSNGNLFEQFSQKPPVERTTADLLNPVHTYKPYIDEVQLMLPENLLLNNGTGGFAEDAKSYKIITDAQRTTPAPWVNVIANKFFGTVISESGSAYTWALNAHEYRLTPWNNDPVCDSSGEAFYLRDEETGFFWSPAPYPIRSSQPYVTTHGFGYTIFEHIEEGIHTEMCVFVDIQLSVKFIVLKIKNQSNKIRKLSATGYVEYVLGDIRSKTSMHIVTEQDADTGALFTYNRYNTAFNERASFFQVDGPNLSHTADRSAFIGRNNNLQKPAALYRTKLSGKTGAALDPCAALQIKFNLLEGEEREVIFRFGNEANVTDAKALIQKFQDPESVKKSLEDVHHYWENALGKIKIETPDAALNILANGWLLYQTMASRLFARSGFYQSGGAFGFRDQLQDVLALLHVDEELAKQQILLSASRQFIEGDVQHWWHPPEGRGVRTRCSDDYLWLPYVTARYINATGNKEILREVIPYISMRPLNNGEESIYDLPANTNRNDTLYEHCVKAIEYGFKLGVHGLPLMGSGDWNDGMDKVGNEGKGESVWLAFFLYDVLKKFADVSLLLGDDKFAQVCNQRATTLQQKIEENGWDGKWYLRAYFDDGTPLGSHANEECSIDAIAQSWSVISGAGDDTRKRMAMESLNEHLVRRDLQLIQLLDPPFNNSQLNPGYIKGYVPGVRENGGQYSHGAVWVLMAFAALGERERTWELFNMINPLNHASSDEKIKTYKVEPYVIAADVYANESNKGRGGWTWYTGSAGWMYQFITESLLGLRLLANRLFFKPCIPPGWPSVKINYMYGKTSYHIQLIPVANGAEPYFQMDNQEIKEDSILLSDDGQEHDLKVYFRNQDN